MTLDEQLKGRFTEEEVRHLYSAWIVSGAIGEESFVELYRGNGWIKKTELEEAKEKWDSETEKEWSAGSIVDLAEEIFILYEKEIERLKGGRDETC